jgi:hypothetical protein
MLKRLACISLVRWPVDFPKVVLCCEFASAITTVKLVCCHCCCVEAGCSGLGAKMRGTCSFHGLRAEHLCDFGSIDITQTPTTPPTHSIRLKRKRKISTPHHKPRSFKICTNWTTSKNANIRNPGFRPLRTFRRGFPKSTQRRTKRFGFRIGWLREAIFETPMKRNAQFLH